uniref:Uncharacterized protein n=1 Tax=Arundo donax TaxID=35708 RepID=A0A0A8ZQ50_ARUDO
MFAAVICTCHVLELVAAEYLVRFSISVRNPWISASLSVWSG